jgi:hypothetical protein
MKTWKPEYNIRFDLKKIKKNIPVPIFSESEARNPYLAYGLPHPGQGM